jgi:hypothetical protein
MMINITKQFFCIGLIVLKKFFVLLIWALGGMYHIAGTLYSDIWFIHH